MVPDAIVESSGNAAEKKRILHDGELLAVA
jgi:hypothetical protein